MTGAARITVRRARLLMVACFSTASNNGGGPTRNRSLIFMKTILTVILLACAFCGGACSRSDKPDNVQTTPNPNLKSDAERLQMATAKAAEERRKAQAKESPAPSAAQP
jgi:hypothetical protein